MSALETKPRSIQPPAESANPQDHDRHDRYWRSIPLFAIAQRYILEIPPLTDETAEWTAEHVDKIKHILLELAPHAHPKLNDLYPRHILYTGIVARKTAEAIQIQLQERPDLHYPEFNVHRFEAEVILGLTHDVYKHLVPHQYMRDEAVGRAVSQINWNPDPDGPVIKLLPRFNHILYPKDEVVNGKGSRAIFDETLPNDEAKITRALETMTPAAIVMDVVDNLSRPNRDSTILTVDKVVEVQLSQIIRYQQGDTKKGGYGITKRSLENLLNGKQMLATKLFLAEMTWIEANFNIDLQSILNEALVEYNTPEHQAWLRQYLSVLGDENLDPNQDKLLKRPDIKTIIFDYGEVLIDNADELLFKEIQERIKTNHHTERTIEEIAGAIKTNPELLIRASTSKDFEERYLRSFFSALGLAYPGLTTAKSYFDLDSIYQPRPEMQQLISWLARYSNVRIVILSDTISPLEDGVKRSVSRYFPSVIPSDVITSPSLGHAKREHDGQAFKALLEYLGITKDEFDTVVFVDNLPENVHDARRVGVRAVTYIHGRTDYQSTLVQKVKQARLWGKMISLFHDPRFSHRISDSRLHKERLKRKFDKQLA